VLFSTDLIYDVLRKHQPDMSAARRPRRCRHGLLDLRRLGDMLLRIKGGLSQELERVSPLRCR